MEAKHYVPQPRFLFFLRIAQIVLAVITLALTAFAMTTLNSIWVSGTFGYTIFCCVFTLLGGGYLLITEALFINAWNRWVALTLDIIGVVFWIAAWGSLAAWAALNDLANKAWSSVFKRDAFPEAFPARSNPTVYGYDTSGSSSSSYSGSSYDSTYSSTYNSMKNHYAKIEAAWKCTAAAAGLGAVIWVMYFIALITFSIALHRFRRARLEARLNRVPVVVEVKGQNEIGNMQPVYQQPVVYQA